MYIQLRVQYAPAIRIAEHLDKKETTTSFGYLNYAIALHFYSSVLASFYSLFFLVYLLHFFFSVSVKGKDEKMRNTVK